MMCFSVLPSWPRRVAAALAVGLAACSSDAPPAPVDPAAPTPPSEPGRYVSDLFPTVDATRNVEYGASIPFGASAPAALRLDLFTPAGDTASARPVLLLIHGGGFVSGNRNDPNIVELATRLARRGFVTASLSYRLRTSAQVAADEAGTIRDALDDAKAAVRWMRANATTYRIDPTRIAIGGGSAGGYTALGATYYEGEGNSGTPGQSSSVRAVISFWGGMLNPNEVEAGEAPMLLIHGTNDQTVPYSQSTTIRDRAQAVGVSVDLRTLTGAPHGYWTPMSDYVNWASAFLRQHLALP